MRYQGENRASGTGTGAGTGARLEMRVEERESLGTYEVVTVVIEAGWKTREGGQRQLLTSNHSRKTRRPSETVASCGGPEPRDGRRGTGSGRAEKRRRSARNPKRVIDAMWGKGETSAEGEKNVGQESVGSIGSVSIDAAPEDLLIDKRKGSREGSARCSGLKYVCMVITYTAAEYVSTG